MDVRVHEDWRRILTRAWSMRFTALAGVFSGLVVLAPYLAPRVPFAVFAGFAIAANLGAGITRLLSQKEFRSGGAP
jgi:predicted benzoate:H+ symporter BenE